MTTLLKAKDISKIYPGEVPTPVLRDISLDVNAGETLAIVGKSGEGKSTLLHILGTLEAPTSGTVEFDGKIPSSQELPHLRSQKIGFIFQAYHLIEEETALYNVLLPDLIVRRKPDIQKGMALLEEVGLQNRAKTPAKFLSGGEKQRVAIARAFCNDPQLILADEPTGNLDHTHSEMIETLLINAVKKRGKTLILVTHDENFARHLDRMISLKDGQLYTFPT